MSRFDDVIPDGFLSEQQNAGGLSWLGDHAGVVLPPDIEEVWGRGRKDGTGCLAANTARYLIGEWGLERFRGSAIHKQALEEERRLVESRRAQDDFRKRDLKAISGGSES